MTENTHIICLIKTKQINHQDLLDVREKETVYFVTYKILTRYRILFHALHESSPSSSFCGGQNRWTTGRITVLKSNKAQNHNINFGWKVTIIITFLDLQPPSNKSTTQTKLYMTFLEFCLDEGCSTALYGIWLYKLWLMWLILQLSEVCQKSCSSQKR